MNFLRVLSVTKVSQRVPLFYQVLTVRSLYKNNKIMTNKKVAFMKPNPAHQQLQGQAEYHHKEDRQYIPGPQNTANLEATKTSSSLPRKPTR